MKLFAFAKPFIAIGVLASLSGCLISSPYWNQQFADRTSAIPVQAFTLDNSKPVKFECARASHGGLHPSEQTATWTQFASVNPSGVAYDSNGLAQYSAGLMTVLPATCWRQDSNSRWYSAIRATQGEGSNITQFYTFNKTGLECMGRENGKSTSWLGWLTGNCHLTYSNSSSPIHYVIFRAQS